MASCKRYTLRGSTCFFSGTDVKITSFRKKQLGVAIGSNEHKAEFVTEKVNEWINQTENLAKVAAFDPHSAYVAYISVLQHR